MTENKLVTSKRESVTGKVLSIGTIVLYLFVFSIFLSKALGNIFAGLLILGMFGFLALNKENINFTATAKFGAILYAVGLIINFAVGGAPGEYIIKYYYLLLPAMFSIFIRADKIEKFLIVFQIGVLGNIVYGFAKYIYQYFQNLPTERFSGAFHTGREGDILLMVLILNISLLANSALTDRKIKYMTVFNTVAVTIAIVLTETRGSWLGLFAGIMVFVLISKKKAYYVALAVFILLLFGGNNLINNKVTERVKSIANTSSDGSNIGRIQIWNVATGVVKENLLFGVGRSNVDNRMKEYYNKQSEEFKTQNEQGIKFGRNVHSSFLQILIEYGIFFLTLFIIFSIVILAELVKRLKTDDAMQKGIVSAAICIVIGYYVSQIFHSELFSHGSYIFYFIIGLALGYKEKEPVKISLVISVYKDIKYLDLVLRSVKWQVYKNFEVIIAEDNDGKEMRDFIKEVSKTYDFAIKHVSQEDIGFRKNKILNKAIQVAEGEYVLFIDGDCVLHKMFIYQYIKNIKNNFALFGRRTHVSKKLSEKLIKTKNINLLTLPVILFTRGRRKEESFYLPFITSRRKSGVYGCNFMVSKKDLLEVNGFDEEYEGPYYGEDNDIERRLRLKGVKFSCIKRKTIQYHLYHEKGDRKKDWEKNKKIYERKSQEGKYYCELGIEKPQ